MKSIRPPIPQVFPLGRARVAVTELIALAKAGGEPARIMAGLGNG